MEVIKPGFVHNKPVAINRGWMHRFAWPMRTPKHRNMVHNLQTRAGASRIWSPSQTLKNPDTTSRKEASRQLGAVNLE